MGIFDILRSDGYITVNKALARKIGLAETIILAELIRWQEHITAEGKLDDGMFFCTVETMEDNTTFSKHQQSKAISRLQELNLISYKQKGLPAKRYFRVHEQAVTDLILDNKKLKNLTTDSDAGSGVQNGEKPCPVQKLKNLTTGSEKIEQLEVKKVNSNINIFKNNILKDDDDDRFAIISEIYEKFKDQIDIPTFNVVLERVEKSKPNNYKACLAASVQNEINKQAEIDLRISEAADQKGEVRTPKKEKTTRSKTGKPHLPVVQYGNSEPVTEDRLKEILAKAEKLDNNGGDFPVWNAEFLGEEMTEPNF